MEEAFRERAAQQTFVTPSSLEGSLTSSREVTSVPSVVDLMTLTRRYIWVQALLSEVYSRQEVLKEELVAGQRELMGSMRRHTDARLQELAATAREVSSTNPSA